MKNRNVIRRIVCLVLAAALLAGFAVPVRAADGVKVSFEQIDNSAVCAKLPGRNPVELSGEQCPYADTDLVRVSIVLEKASTIEAGYSPLNIAQNTDAMNYRDALSTDQNAIVTKIERATTEELDVVWNLTLAANIISANVEYGQIETIEKIAGVKSVLIETQYEPDVVSKREADPNMATSGKQIGSSLAWASGYTGAGSRIAIIDTGTDTEHQSFSAEGFEYALKLQAEEAGMTLEAYMEELNLLDVEEIQAVANRLNVKIDPDKVYVNSKLPFGYNYADDSYYITHVRDNQSEHGSHVAGIAAANAYIPEGNGVFSKALDSVLVQGVAPDAQIITMKIFGITDGGNDSDYMAAIEDAILLGCDAINLSIGSGNPGMTRASVAEYQAILDNLVESGVVVTISAGNSGYWSEHAYNAGYLYTDDVSMQTNGSPGSYTNALTVASVDNDGATGYFVSVGDVMAFYTESAGYSNKPYTTIPGEYDFVFIDGFGTAADWAAAGDAMKGAIAICSRGEISFFEKASNAVQAGAAGILVYNNEAGILYMDLTGYTYTRPVASITQADGAKMKAAATPVMDENGSVLYYTGKITVNDSVAAGQFNSDYYTMSTFSSWGVPGSLELKPEITAPGGGINSVYGQTPDGGGFDQYELMDGTSMAAPQVAGMAAVFAQYAREVNLEERTNQDIRTLTNSLLMSTAVPMIDGSTDSYYSVIQQGAGLGNVGLAITADSYILMSKNATDSYADGKVKAELGDDPDRTGAYSFSFTINNMVDEDRFYNLDADFFIQDYFQYYANGNESADEMAYYMDTWTKPIDVSTTFTVNGSVLGADIDLSLDFNDDGTVNEADGMALLDYTTGLIPQLANASHADLDNDGDIDSHDAYAFFTRTNDAVKVPANGSVSVTVDIALSDAARAQIEEYYPNGTYIEGYVFVQGVSTAEGIEGTMHSIPVLGFYGNWSDASMFDVGTSMEYYHGEEYRMPYLGNEDANTFIVAYGGDSAQAYHFGGNPFVPDDTYMPERNAINSENGDTIHSVIFTSIRNAAASRFMAVNKTTGEILMNMDTGEAYSAYYYVIGGAWYNTGYELGVQFVPESAAPNDLLELSMTLVPEYYVDAQGNVDWDSLGEGTTLTTSMVVDNDVPQIQDVQVDLENNTMTITASDNQYVAAVALYNKSGTKVHTYTGAKQDIGPNETAEFVLDLTGVYGKNFTVQVMDYAMNTSTWSIAMEIGEEPVLPEMIAFDLDFNHWTTLGRDTVGSFDGLAAYMPSDYIYYAGTIADQYVFAVTDVGDLHVMPQYDLTDVTIIKNLGCNVYDMAYNKADDQIYGLIDDDLLITIDKLTGDVAVVGELGVTSNTLACDPDGTFYCNAYNTGAIYTFTLETMDNPRLLVENVGIESGYIQSMEYNPNTELLCWASYYISAYDGYGYSYYYEIDPISGKYNKYNDLWDELSALLIPDLSSTEGAWAEPTDTVSRVLLFDDSISLLKGTSNFLRATVLPWNASNRDVIWSSDNESIATVNANGKVTAVNVGTATITATSKLDPDVSASCKVNVQALQVTLKGALMDADGNPMFYEWNMEEDSTWTGGTIMDTTMISSTMDAINNMAYVMDYEAFSMHLVDPATGISEDIASNGIAPLWDMEYSTFFSTASDPRVHAVYGPYFLPSQKPMSLDGLYFDLSSYLANNTGASYLVAVASAGPEEYYDEENATWVDTEHLVMLDNTGAVWHFWVYEDDSEFTGWIGLGDSDLNTSLAGNGEVMYTSMSVGEDGALYVSTYENDTNDLYRLILDEATGTYDAQWIGDYGDGVWPATITSVTSNASSARVNAAAPKAIEKVCAVAGTAEEIASFQVEGKPHLGSADRSGKASVTVETVEAVEAAVVPMSRPDKTVQTASSAASEDTITVTVSAKDMNGADVFSRNGKMTVDYNAESLTLVQAVVDADYASVNDNPDSVVFAYVDLEGIAAGDAVATLVFTRNDGAADEGTITITDEEVDDTNPDYAEELMVCPSKAFSDLNTASWYHPYTDYVLSAGLMNGISSTSFAPDHTLTRGMLITTLYRLAGEPEVTQKSTFTDLPANAYYEEAVAWAQANGIAKGVTGTTFCPEKAVTREQAATFLYRYVTLYLKQEAREGADLNSFKDGGATSEFAQDAMAWAAAEELFEGFPDNTLRPKESMTRAQMAKLLTLLDQNF